LHRLGELCGDGGAGIGPGGLLFLMDVFDAADAGGVWITLVSHRPQFHSSVAIVNLLCWRGKKL
jgi:hypothetical protein